MRNPFRFKRQNGIYYVIYRHDEAHPRSTHTRHYDDAVAWAFQHLDHEQDHSPLFRDFTRNFFISGKCPWTDRITVEKKYSCAPTFL